MSAPQDNVMQGCHLEQFSLAKRQSPMPWRRTQKRKRGQREEKSQTSSDSVHLQTCWSLSKLPAKVEGMKNRVIFSPRLAKQVSNLLLCATD